jgi:hypothetical protein
MKTETLQTPGRVRLDVQLGALVDLKGGQGQ